MCACLKVTEYRFRVAHKEKKDIPFIVTTEYGSIPDAVRAIKLGAKDYLPKPVHREHLLELAEEIFRPLATVRTKPKDLFRCTCPKYLRWRDTRG